MPWCDDCARYWAPNTLPADGRCPTCGAAVSGGGRASEGALSTSTEPYRAPWHFWLLLVAATVYLLWRFVQIVAAIVT